MRMKPFRAVAFALAALVAASVAMPAHADCFDEAALYQKVNPLILRADGGGVIAVDARATLTEETP